MTLPALLRSLAQATRNHPLERKILICPNKQTGRELLRALSSAGTPWLGWEVTTPWLVALELVHDDLLANGESVADEFRIMRVLDDALDDITTAGRPELRAARTSVSFRNALQRAVGILRGSGRELEGIQTDSRILAATLEVVARYELRLRQENLLDRAAVMRHAIEKLRTIQNSQAELRMFVLPTTRFGLRGELIELLLQRGATLLEGEPVFGLERPAALLRTSASAPTPSTLSFLHAPESAPTPAPAPVVLFAAATPMDELREVLRRVAAQQLPWDQVEIIASDARTYGNALYALARRLGIPLTMANGIDLARTRTGRAIRGYLGWLRDSFPAEAFRVMLETGDVAAKDPPGVPGSRLAYRLRRLRIGWGKQRYYQIIERALRAALTPAAPDDTREAQEAERARERERNELRALRDTLIPILQAAPDAPPRLRAREALHTPASIARGLLVFLEHVAAGDDQDAMLRELVRERLERAASELNRETSWDAALAIIERAVETRVSPDEEGAPAWTSAPGRLHFSDLRSGGLAARPCTFVVGLDASRVAVFAGLDPILTESARRDVLDLPGERERAAVRRYELAELLAGLRGQVTLSFAAWDATEGRAVPPAMELLQALRLRERNPALTYSDLHSELGALIGAVPQGTGRLDTSDVWLSALTSASGVLYSASQLVEAAYPHLARGQRARRARLLPHFTPYHGQLRRPASTARTFSATQLESLGTCPRRYFYRYVLRVEPPDLIEFDPEKWLDPLERGSLLHLTYENTLRRARERGVEYRSQEFGVIAVECFRESVALTADRLPPPGDEVLQREVRELQADMRRFVTMIRRLQPEWIELEYRFGEGERAMVVETALGPLRLRGAIDRIDQLEDGRLLVVDYKTGRKWGYWPSRPFNGGRRIQHVVYSAAAARLLGREVFSMEYHFPTMRGEYDPVVYFPRTLGAPEEALARLQRIAQSNSFPATEDARDCRYCDFAAACRVRVNDFGTADSPPANWMKEQGIELAEADALRILRRHDG